MPGPGPVYVDSRGDVFWEQRLKELVYPHRPLVDSAADADWIVSLAGTTDGRCGGAYLDVKPAAP